MAATNMLAQVPDTWPVLGLGGVVGTGQGTSFYCGGYGGMSMGCMPLGCFDAEPARPRPEVSAHCFLGDLLDTEPDCCCCCAEEETSPKSIAGFDFEAELVAEQVLATEQVAWQQGCAQD